MCNILFKYYTLSICDNILRLSISDMEGSVLNSSIRLERPSGGPPLASCGMVRLPVQVRTCEMLQLNPFCCVKCH